MSISASEQVTVDAPLNDDLTNHTINSTNNIDFIQPKSSYETDDFVEFAFSSKGLNISNLNIRHVIPKVDEISVLMASDNSPDILGLCETVLQKNNPDSQISINGFNVLRKDRSDTREKYGGGLLLYSRQSLNIKRRTDIEISNIETLWAEVCLPTAKPFLICTVYRPPSAYSEWTDLFEAELSVAQASGLELILMGDFNIDITSSTNNKWMNLIQLFDLTQLISSPTRTAQSSSSIIDHVNTSNPEYITESFVPHYAFSDHFPVCFTRKVMSKISKNKHITTTYRCYKTFDENLFLTDLTRSLEHFEVNRKTVNEDLWELISVMIQCLDKLACYY